MTERTELGPLPALPTARHAAIECGIRLSPAQYGQLAPTPDVLGISLRVVRSDDGARRPVGSGEGETPVPTCPHFSPILARYAAIITSIATPNSTGQRCV